VVEGTHGLAGNVEHGAGRAVIEVGRNAHGKAPYQVGGGGQSGS
jgi:hypothetical protein